MPIFTTDTCFGCETPIEPAGGRFHCDPCAEKQDAEEAAEWKAFDDYHEWADSLARSAPTTHTPKS